MFFEGLSPEEDKCCGCSACMQICPKQAISWIESKDGFAFPKVDMEKCIECGLCEKVCPMVHTEKVLPKNIGVAYGAVNKDEKELSCSSSGGVFALIADYVLQKGGRVFGAAFDAKMQLHHRGIGIKDDLYSLQGSKYLQSQNNNTYTEIRTLLKDGLPIYYVGTGCQVAGLKLFLRKDYENLYTSDILCHGTPPQKVFDEVIRYLQERYKGKVEEYLFRDKSVWGWSCSSSSKIRIRNKLKYIGYEKVQDGYFNAFIKGDNYRESCYVCPYAQSSRCGDVTLADFWGAEKYIPGIAVRKGVSAILVNTLKGERILNHIRSKADLYDAKLKDIKVINKTLVAPTPRPEERNRFFERFRENPIRTLKSYSGSSKKRFVVYHLKRNKVTSALIKQLKSVLNR